MQRQRLLRAKQINTRNIQRNPRACTRLAILRGCTACPVLQHLVRQIRRLVQLRLKAEPIRHVPALGLGQLNQDILLQRISPRILNGGIHLVKQRQIVQIPLCLQQRSLVQRITRMHLHLLLHNAGPGMLHARKQNVINRHLLAFHHVQGHIGDELVVSGNLRTHLNLRVIKSMRDIPAKNRVAVVGQRDQGKRLPGLRTDQVVDRIVARSIHTGNIYRAELLLHTLIHRVCHRDLRLHLAVFARHVNILRAGRNLRIQKSTCPVQRLDGTRIRIHKLLTVHAILHVKAGPLHP